MNLKEKKIIAIGHKARQGKDTFAEIFYNYLQEDTFIIHWADALKKEVSNTPRKFPLIYSIVVEDVTYYNLLNANADGSYIYDSLSETEIPALHNLFKKRNINKYLGMDEKDSELLQIWGTDYRRNKNPNYWINLTMEIIKHRPEKYILIPDTRFKNEYNAIKKDSNNIYIDIVRLNKDGSIYIDKNRDPKHPSEIDLDKIPFDYQITEYSGNIESFNNKSISLIKEIIKENV